MCLSRPVWPHRLPSTPGERWGDGVKRSQNTTTNYTSTTIQSTCSTNCLPDTHIALPLKKGFEKQIKLTLCAPSLLLCNWYLVELRKMSSCQPFYGESYFFAPKNTRQRNTNPREVTALRVLVSSVHVRDVGLHHVLHKLLEGDLRHPAELLLRLGAVTLKKRREGKGGRQQDLSAPTACTVRRAICSTPSTKSQGRDNHLKGKRAAHGR